MKETSMYLHLLRNLILDCADLCSTTWCSRDFKTAKSRVKHEGLSFLTITLPQFCDDFFLSLERGYVDSSSFTGWRKTKCLPCFLQGFTSRVFDSSTGRSLDEPQINSVHSVRQICLFFKKIKLACSDSRIAKAIADYQKTDDELAATRIKRSAIVDLSSVASVLVSDVFPSFVDECDLLPHHGPGSTADRVTGNQKYDNRKFDWYDSLDECFSPGLTIYPSEEHHRDLSFRHTAEEPVVRVVHVPKTLKTPRIIAMEPVAMQMAQQSVKDFLVAQIEKAPLTTGHINFSDQEVNRQLALRNSKTKELATLDLSQASDRVRNDLVCALFEVNPGLSALIQSCRSPLANVEGELRRLSKFASMGSALCFPVEAMLFYCICLIGRCKAKGISFPVTRQTLYDLSRDIYVYGDDILVPSDEVEAITDTLSIYCLKVSTSKSFVHSNFRESCGMDAFNGKPITPVYCRAPLLGGQRASRIVSHVATARQLHNAGLLRSYEYLKEIVHKSVGFVLPTVDDTCPGLGWVDSIRGKTRWNSNYQRQEVLTLVPSISFKKDKIDGIPALLKCLIRLNQKHNESEINYSPDRIELLYRSALSQDVRHLRRTPVRGALTLKRRWVPPY